MTGRADEWVKVALAALAIAVLVATALAPRAPGPVRIGARTPVTDGSPRSGRLCAVGTGIVCVPC